MHNKNLAKRYTSLHEAFEKNISQIIPNEKCMPWEGFVLENGYGQLSFKGKRYLAHRLSYIYYYGEIPAGVFVCHHCDTRNCVNPSHLFLGTHRENMQDMARKGRIKGEKHPMAKMSNDNIVLMRSLHPSMPQAKLASLFHISQTQVSDILSRKSWSHI